MSWTSPRTWVSGETVTAALLNTHLRDNLKMLNDSWPSFTPSWTAATTNPTLGNGTLIGRVIQTNKRLEGYITLTAGSTTTFGSGAWMFSMPATPVSGRLFTFHGGINDASGGLYEVYGYVQSGAIIDLRADPTTAGNLVRGVTSAVPIAWATGDQLHMPFRCEAA